MCSSAHRKLEGLIGTDDVSLIAIFSTIDFSNGDNCADSAEEVLKSKSINTQCLEDGIGIACVPFDNYLLFNIFLIFFTNLL